MMLRLQTSTLGPLGVSFRALRGADEMALDGTGLLAAFRLVHRLLLPSQDGFLLAEDLQHVSIADFDRMLGACHRALYGDAMECRISCTSCEEPLEFNIPLDELLSPSDASDAPSPDQQPGWFAMTDGRRFRLPTVGEVLAARPVDSLVTACTEGAWSADALDQAMAAVGPQGSDVIETHCAECGSAQSARLDLATYLIQMLTRERSFLAREVHVIARSYRWSHREIMDLSREDRRAYVRLIESEAAALARSRRRVA